ncbi:hypothetical protein MKX01_008643 [Papaver californicum]|nr:hypothetical protein MKX01_008643 [Papaver californicum]
MAAASHSLPIELLSSAPSIFINRNSIFNHSQDRAITITIIVSVTLSKSSQLPFVHEHQQHSSIVIISSFTRYFSRSQQIATSIGAPLWRLFGGASYTITTDITIPICSPDEAAKLASKYLGKNLNADIDVLKAIRVAHRECSFILDANEGYTSSEAIEVLDKLHEMGVTRILFEQPVHRDDWEGLAADESCRSLVDVEKIIEGNLADVINIKLAKIGVLGALEIIELARKSGLDLIIGGMVETRLAMGFSGHLSAGLWCFKFIDLDMPLLLSEDPVVEGIETVIYAEHYHFVATSGAVYKLTNARGHGGFLHWDSIAW